MLPTHGKIAGAFIAGFSLVLLAGAAESPKLNIKPGLWEFVGQVQINGAPAIPEASLARLTPEQRAKIEAAMQASRANAAKPKVSKNCLTPEKIQRGLDIEQQKDPSCQRKILSNSGSELDISEDCTNEQGHRSIREHFELSGSEALSGTVNVVNSADGKTMTVNSNIQGKWLSASCGDIKDMEIEK